jgi:hypothetical protein
MHFQLNDSGCISEEAPFDPVYVVSSRGREDHTSGFSVDGSNDRLVAGRISRRRSRLTGVVVDQLSGGGVDRSLVRGNSSVICEIISLFAQRTDNSWRQSVI